VYPRDGYLNKVKIDLSKPGHAINKWKATYYLKGETIEVGDLAVDSSKDFYYKTLTLTKAGTVNFSCLYGG